MSVPARPLIEQRADPHISFHGGWYWFTATVPSYDRIELRRARSIADLAAAEPVTVWERHRSGPMSWHIWAPELHRLDQRWYLYFAAGEAESIWKIRPYLLECGSDDPLTGPWVERGVLRGTADDVLSFQGFSLDATVFEHRGKRYLVWAQIVDGNSNLYLAPLASPGTLAGMPVLLSTPEHPWETVDHRVNEGPAVLIRRGTVFLTYSASGTGACYCMGLLTAPEDSDLLDPQNWSKRTTPVLASDPDQHRFGPGHNSFTVSSDGLTDLLVYHARIYAAITGDPLSDPNRHTWVRPVVWRSDGSPDFDTPSEPDLLV